MMKKYRDLTPEEWWEISDNLTPEDIMNGEVDHFLDDNYFWRQIEYEHPDLVSFLDNRFAIINKEYGVEKLHKLSKQHPRKKWEQIIAWYNHENNQNTNENKNMKKNKIRITESKLKQIVDESVKKVLKENEFHSAYKDAKNNPVLSSEFTEDDVFDTLETLRKRLKHERELAATGQYSRTGERINYLVGAIRGIEAYIKSRY